MLRSAAISRIQRGLGYRSDQVDNIVFALKEAQRLFEQGRSLPYFLLEEDAPFALAAGTADIALPARFLREKRGETFHFTTTDNKLVVLEKIDIDVGRERFVSEVPGPPVAYSLRKGTIKFYPERDVVYTLEWSYYRGGVLLDSDIENVWLEEEFGSPDSLIGKAGMSIASDLNNKVAFEKFKVLYAESWAGAFADGILREEEGQPLNMGSKL